MFLLTSSSCILFDPFLFLVSLQVFWSLIKRNAEYKPMEFLCFAFVYRIYEKLRQFEPAVKPKFTVSDAISIFNDIIRSKTSELFIMEPTYFVVWFVNYESGCWLQEDGEEEGRVLRMGKRFLRSLAWLLAV